MRLITCGWESGNQNEIGLKSVGGTDGEAISTTARSGGYSLKSQYTGAAGTGGWCLRVIPLLGTPSEIWIRVGIGNIVIPNSTNFTNSLFIQLMNGNTVQLSLGATGTNPTVVAYRAGTAIASGGIFPYTTGMICYEIHAVIHGTTGRLTVWADGAQVIDFTGNTMGAATAAITDIRLGMHCITATGYGAGHTESVLYDDFAVNDTTGTRNNSRIGRGGVYPLFPIADTADKDFARSAGSDNYSLVNSAPPDDDATYVQDGVTNDRDLYSIQSLNGQGQIDAVTVLTRMKSVGGSGARGAPTILSGGTESVGSQGQFGNVYAYNSQTWETDPNTTNPWSYTAIASLQIGVTVQ